MTSTNSNAAKLISETSSGSVLLQVMVQPRASKDQVVGIHGNHIKIRLTSPPVEGAANKALVKFLSKKLKIPASKITIKRGQRARQKLLEVEGASAKDVKKKLGI